jgi:hypothetical protein
MLSIIASSPFYRQTKIEKPTPIHTPYPHYISGWFRTGGETVTKWEQIDENEVQICDRDG